MRSPTFLLQSSPPVLDEALGAFSDFVWNWPVAILLVGGGIFFMLYARAVPLRYFGHAIQVVRGKFDSPDDPGEISHFRALSSALAATVGMGNISGVAVAIATGGPGALFWMWISAFFGMATKFFTCSLSIMYRKKDESGEVQGGPMYFIEIGLGRRFRWLAIFFSIAGLIGSLAIVQSNQLTQILRDEVFTPNGWFLGRELLGNGIVAILIMLLVSVVIFGGIRRIALVASRLVPAMVVLYMGAAVWILLWRMEEIPGFFGMILTDAWTGRAVMGGAVGEVIKTGVRRAAFSNEAGIGTEAMAHGAARTREPIREGLVAMLGPLVDTLIVCNATAFVILSAGNWENNALADGVTMTARAFELSLPGFGRYLLILCVICFSVSTMLGYSYYGCKCAGYLFGTRAQRYYNLFYVVALGLACMVSLGAVLALIDGVFALMAIPTMTASLLLAPRVMAATRSYFRRHEAGEFDGP